MYKWILTPILVLFLNQAANAASVFGEICISMSILNQSSQEDVIFGSGGYYECASVSGTAEATVPGETVTFDDYTDNLTILGGGTNLTGETVYFTYAIDWYYNIESITDTNETANVHVWSDWPDLNFTSGSGSGSHIYESYIEHGLAVDYTGGTYAEASASSTMPAVPVPASIWLLSSGLLYMVGIMRRRST